MALDGTEDDEVQKDGDSKQYSSEQKPPRSRHSHLVRYAHSLTFLGQQEQCHADLKTRNPAQFRIWQQSFVVFESIATPPRASRLVAFCYR